MTRRRLLCGLLLLSVVLACGAGALWIANGRKVTRVRLERVKKGMTREEVIRTVGGPAGDYAGRDVILSGFPGRSLGFPGRSLDYQTWVCADGELLVLFDDAGVAIEVAVLDVEDPLGPPTLTERIRRWLGL
jgi:hypothetical protein